MLVIYIYCISAWKACIVSSPGNATLQLYMSKTDLRSAPGQMPSTYFAVLFNYLTRSQVSVRASSWWNGWGKDPAADTVVSLRATDTWHTAAAILDLQLHQCFVTQHHETAIKVQKLHSKTSWQRKDHIEDPWGWSQGTVVWCKVHVH